MVHVASACPLVQHFSLFQHLTGNHDFIDVFSLDFFKRISEEVLETWVNVQNVEVRPKISRSLRVSGEHSSKLGESSFLFGNILVNADVTYQLALKGDRRG